MALGTAFFWALAIVSFNSARIVANGDVFITNFLRILSATVFISIVGMFRHEYYKGFKKENRIYLKYQIYIGIAGSLSLGLADSLFYKAAEINGLIFTSTITASTPLIQQLASVLILKEKFRKRFLIAVILIILGNYIVIFI
jgi:drug/metabolite transporter (DMT)-like permease